MNETLLNKPYRKNICISYYDESFCKASLCADCIDILHGARLKIDGTVEIISGYCFNDENISFAIFCDYRNQNITFNIIEFLKIESKFKLGSFDSSHSALKPFQ